MLCAKNNALCQNLPPLKLCVAICLSGALCSRDTRLHRSLQWNGRFVATQSFAWNIKLCATSVTLSSKNKALCTVILYAAPFEQSSAPRGIKALCHTKQQKYLSYRIFLLKLTYANRNNPTPNDSNKYSLSFRSLFVGIF